MKKQRFVFFFWFVDWKCISLGLSFNAWPTHIEIHLPFGFVKFGMVDWGKDEDAINWSEVKWRQTDLRIIAATVLIAFFIYTCAFGCSQKEYQVKKYQQAKSR